MIPKDQRDQEQIKLLREKLEELELHLEFAQDPLEFQRFRRVERQIKIEIQKLGGISYF